MRLAVMSALMFSAVSCAKDDFQKEEPIPAQNAISVSRIDIAPLGGECTFTVSSDSKWKISGIPSWLSVVEVNGKKALKDGDRVKAGTRSFTASASVNDEHTGIGTWRETVLVIDSENGSLVGHVKVEQPCPYFVITARKPGAGAAGELGHSDSVVFPWNFTSERPFGREAVAFTVESNTGWRIVKDVTKSVSFDYRKYSRKTVASGDAEAASAGVPARSGVEDGWLETPSLGEYELNEAKVWTLPFIPETYNATGENRSLRLKFIGASGTDGKPLDEYVVDFSQNNVRFNVGMSEDYSRGYVEFPAAHSNGMTMTVDSEIDWYVEKDAAWLSTVPETPQGTGLGADSPSSSFSLNISHPGCGGNANPEKREQVSSLRIIGKAGETLLPNEVNVRQAAYIHSLSANSVQIANNDLSSKSFDVMSSGEWTVSGIPDWIAVEPVSGSGHVPETVQEPVSVRAMSQNLGFSARTAKLNVASELNSLSESFSVSQDPYIFEAKAGNLSLNTLSTDKYKLDIKSSGKWRVEVSYDGSPSSDWLGISATSGTGDATLSYGALTGNEVQEDRFGVISIHSVTHEEAGIAVEPVKIRITQRKYTFEVSPLPEALGVLAFGPLSDDSRVISVACSHIWNVSGSEWISALPSSGSGDGKVVVKVQNNLTKSDRSGTFTISSSLNGVTHSQTYNVTQSAFVFNVAGTSFTDLAPVQTSSYTTSVECSGDWKVEIPSDAASWISATPSSGKASDRSVTFKVSDNILKSPRTAEVRISSALGGYSETVLFQQNQFVFDETAVNIQALTLSPAQTKVPVTISDKAGWAVVGKPSWVTVSPASGTGSGEVTVSVADNYDLSARNSSGFGIRSSKNSLLKPVNVSQSAFVYDTAPVTLTGYAELNASAQQFTMGECMGTWSVKNAPDWASVSVSGSTVTVNASDNLKTTARSAEFTVESQYVAHNSALKKKVGISQSAFVFDGTAAGFTVDAVSPASNSVDVKISSAAPWEMTGVPSWITVTPSQGTGNASVKIECSDNFALSQRSAGDMYVKSRLNGLTKKVSVAQKAFVFDTKAVTVPRFVSYKPAAQTVTVGECIGTWSVKDAPSWLNVSVNGSVLKLTASDNTDLSARTATFRIESQYISQNPALKKEITVSQAGYVFDGTAASLTFSPVEETRKTVNVTCTDGSPWSLVNVPSWVKVSALSGNGSTTITVSVEVNTSEQPRSSSGFAVKSGLTGALKPIEVRQTGFLFDKTAVTVPQFGAYKAASQTVTMGECSGTWSVTGLPDWLSARVNGNSIVLTASDNNDTASRTATFRVESRYIAQNPAFVKEITVSQEGITFDVPSVSHTFDAVDSYLLNININCSSWVRWELVNVPDWVVPTTTSFTGPCLLSIRVEDNPDETERTASGLAVKCTLNGQLVPIFIIQRAKVKEPAPGETEGGETGGKK